MNIDLTTFSFDELLALETRVKTALDDRKKTQVSDLRKKFEEEAAKFGLSLSEITGGASHKAEKTTRAPVAPKYRNPENPSETWTGRGRAPTWLVALEAKGGKREEYLI